MTAPHQVVVSIRGTHGSGKSTVVRKLMERSELVAIVGTPQSTTGKLKTRGYVLRVPGVLREVLVVGPYTTACGGCDAIVPYADIWPVINNHGLAMGRSVVFEGALVSSSCGNIGRAMIDAAKSSARVRAYFAFMDTPLKTCIQQVNARRAAAGKPPLADNRNIVSKFNSIERSILQITALGGPVTKIRRKRAVADVLALLRGERSNGD